MGSGEDGIIPKTLSAFVQDTEGLNLDLDERAWMLEQSAMWRSKPSVQANLVAKIEEGRMDDAPIYSDLKNLPCTNLSRKNLWHHWRISLSAVQSVLESEKERKDPRHLWPYIREHVRAIRPFWCFFENVRGHTTMGLWRVLSDLEEDGYRTEWGLFSAEETGAPHQRIRCFILAYRECEGSQGEIYGGQNKEREGVDGYSRCGGTGAHRRRDSEQLAQSREPAVASPNGGKILAEEAKKNWPARRLPDRRSSTSGKNQPSEDTQWPARPERAIEWEEPRVTATEASS